MTILCVIMMVKTVISLKTMQNFYQFSVASHAYEWHDFLINVLVKYYLCVFHDAALCKFGNIKLFQYSFSYSTKFG